MMVADVVPLVSITRARESRMLFTRPLVTSPSSLFVRQGSGDIGDWADLVGRRVGVIAGGVTQELLSEREKSARLVPYVRLQDALFDLLSDRIDALVSFESSLWKVSESAHLADRIKVVAEPLTAAKRAIAVRRDLPALRDRLDASSEYRELQFKWYAAAPSLRHRVRFRLEPDQHAEAPRRFAGRRTAVTKRPSPSKTTIG